MDRAKVLNFSFYRTQSKTAIKSGNWFSEYNFPRQNNILCLINQMSALRQNIEIGIIFRNRSSKDSRFFLGVI